MIALRYKNGDVLSLLENDPMSFDEEWKVMMKI